MIQKGVLLGYISFFLHFAEIEMDKDLDPVWKKASRDQILLQYPVFTEMEACELGLPQKWPLDLREEQDLIVGWTEDS